MSRSIRSFLFAAILLFAALPNASAQFIFTDQPWWLESGSFCNIPSEEHILWGFGTSVESVFCLESEYYLTLPALEHVLDPPGPGGPNPNVSAEPAEDTERGAGPCEDSQGCGMSTGNPIDISSMNKYQVEVDYVGPGALPLRIARHYNSKHANYDANKGQFGAGWSSNLRERIVAMELPDPSDPQSVYRVVIQNGTGYRFEITSEDNVNWYTLGGRLVLFDYDEAEEIFTWMDGGLGKIFLSSGDLESITHSSGESLVFDYDVTSNPSELTTITHSSGANLTFQYDSSGRIERITDPGQNIYFYYYDANGNLDYVLRPGDDPVHDKVVYHYEETYLPNHLTGISHVWDGVEKRFATWTYLSGGVANSSAHGGTNIDRRDISIITNPTMTERKVSQIGGKDFHYRFELVNGGERIREVEGVANADTPASLATYTYDANGRYDKLTDEEGNVTDYDFDDLGLLTSVTTAFGTVDARTTSYEWDVAWKRPTKITTPLLVTDIVLDSAGLAEKITETNLAAYGVANQKRERIITTERYAGTQVMKRQAIDGPRAENKVVIDYDTNGRVTTVSRTVSPTKTLVTSYSDYDAHGRVGKITYPSGLVHEYDYHPRGAVTEFREIVGAVTRTTHLDYYPSGDLERITYPDGSFDNNIYDAARRLILTTRDDDDTELDDVPRRQFYHDIESNVELEKIWNIVGGWVRNPECGFNDPPGCLRWTWEESVVVMYEHIFDHDSLNRLVLSKWSDSNREVGYEYFKNGILKSAIDGFDRTTEFDLDSNNELRTTTFRDTGTSVIDYDANGNVSAIADPLSKVTTYERDGFGQVWKRISPSSGETNYEYDVAGNLVRKTDARGVTLLYTYDGINRLESVTVEGEPNARETFAYDTDKAGHLYQVTDEVGTHTILRNEAGEVLSRLSIVSGTTLTTSRTYDASGRLDSLTYPSGLVVNYVYDSIGDIDKITAAGAGVSLSDVVRNVQYRPFGPIASFTFGNGEVRAYSFDNDYELESLVSGSSIDRDFSYDLNGNIESFDTRTFEYDVMDRVDRHTGADGTWDYKYDLNGNREWHKENAVQTTYNYDANATQLLTLSGGTTETRSYDLNGNTIQIGGRYFDHNELNRFWRYRDGSLTVTYKHNAFGERQVKDDESTITRFVYSGPNLLHERVGSIKRDYIYLDGLLVGMVKNGVLYFVHGDHLGRPEVVTNSAQSVVWNSQNNAFDNTPSIDLIGNLNIGFPGQYYDIENGMYYNYFRTYDPSTGRYLENDPIGLSGGLNTYGYVDGNPLSFIDPFGLAGEPVDLGGGTNVRIDNPHVPGQQQHAHVQTPKGEVVVNKDGTQSHKGKGSMKNLTNKAKKFLRGKGFNIPGLPSFFLSPCLLNPALPGCPYADLLSCPPGGDTA